MSYLPPIRLTWALLSALSCAWIRPAVAQLVCYEGFGEYGAGVQVETGSNGSGGDGLNGGLGWGGPYNVSNAIKSLVVIENRTSNPGPVNYNDGHVSIPGGNRALRFNNIANGSYAVRRPLGENFDAASAESLWFSFLFRTASTSPLGTQDFFQVGFDASADPQNGNPRVSIGANTISTTDFPADFQFFARSTISVNASANAFHGGPPIASSTTYLLVGQIQPNAGVYDTVSLYVNPSSLDEPGPSSATVTLSSGLTSLAYAFIRTANLDNGDAYVVDEWHVGRDYGSVVGSLRNALQIVSAGPPGSTHRVLRWSAALPAVELETSPTLEPGSWSEVAGPFNFSENDWEYSVPIVPGVARGFYRLRR